MKRGALLVLLFLAPECLAELLPQQDKRPHFTLAVCDQVGLNSEVLALARQQTEEIFRHAEVDVTWIDLDRLSQCTMVPGTSNHFAIVILPHGPDNAVTPDAMGSAPSRAGAFPRAYIFYNWVRMMVDIVERKDLTTVGQGIMLGHAIAHELGHLLMPERTHSLAGIMSTRWDRRHWDDAVAGRLLFQKAEAKAMRTNLLARQR